MSGSVDPAFQAKIELHDRVYQKYSIDHEVYCIPIDEEEEERLTSQNALLFVLFGGRHFYPPISEPEAILDCGYGQGSWAVAVANAYPDCEVTGLDVYPLIPPDVAENDNFTTEQWDLNNPLVPTYEANTYDLVHSRLVAPGLHKNRWPSYLRDLVKLAKPGGWVQVAELYYNFQSHSGMLTEAHALYQWGVMYRQAIEGNRNPRIGNQVAAMLQQTPGLESVQNLRINLPVGTWPTDARERWIGERAVGVMSSLIDSHGIWPFIQKLGMTKEVARAWIERAQEELKDDQLKIYITV